MLFGCLLYDLQWVVAGKWSGATHSYPYSALKQVGFVGLVQMGYQGNMQGNPIGGLGMQQQRPPGLPTGMPGGLPGGLTVQQQQQLLNAQAMQQQQQQQQKGRGRVRLLCS